MKLYVDDLRRCPEGWHLARTVTEAIRVLATQMVTHVSLDHDISHAVEVSGVSRPYPCTKTFEPVAHYLASMATTRFIPQRVTIHTANPAGAERMRLILQQAGINADVQIGKPVNGLEEE